MALTWTPTAPIPPVTLAAKWLAAPLLAIELFVTFLALRRGGLAALHKARLPPVALTAVLALAGTVVATTVFVAPDREIALLLTSIWVLHTSYGLAVLHLCGREFQIASLTTAWMTAFPIFAVGLMMFVTRVAAPTDFDWVQALPAVANVRHLGFYAGAVIGLCIGRFAIVRGRWSFLAVVLVATLAFSIPLWSGSRGTFAASGGALVVGLLLFPALRCRRVIIGISISLLLAAALAASLPKPHLLWGPDRILSTVTSGDITSDRDNLWQATVWAIAERPLFGHGEGQLHVVTSRQERHPHNSLLQVLVAWGVIGAACLLVLGLLFARYVIGTVRSQGGERLPPCLALMVLVAYSMFDGTLFFAFPVSIAAACAGLAAAPRRARDESVAAA